MADGRDSAFAAQLAALHARCFTVPRPWDAGEFATLLASHEVFVLGGAEGFAVGRVTVDEAELLTLAVDPARRRQGLGAALLAEYEAEALRRGAARSLLEVSAQNAPARALYLARGYHSCGRRPGYYRAPDGQRIDAEIMDKALG